MRYVTITTYAKMVGISRESVYKRIKKGTAVLLEDCESPDCESPVIDLQRSRGKMERNDWSGLKGKTFYSFRRGQVVGFTY